MHPQIHISMVAVLVAVVAGFLFGWLWYGPLFGKKWASLMGMKMEDCKPDPKKMMRSMGFALVGTFLTAYVLAHSVQVWRPSTWGVGADQSDCSYGFFAGFFTWLGFYVPQHLGAVCWEGKSWKLFGLNAAYSFFYLEIIGMILAYVK